jgi:hypothetical protein
MASKAMQATAKHAFENSECGRLFSELGKIGASDPSDRLRRMLTKSSDQVFQAFSASTFAIGGVKMP